ncbi:alpha/beta hydrolase [Agromyces seonyuensis]|uniref:Alpha/beta hydrolase fold domain-containing protein n=1 Tax=Agromyces seonyuensis TaxID=2662446 RepID=A0A6I4NZI4_9MICO|nr:alpha/beta hydrolase [Agromyces seonyuensis]MWB99730.1 alpha/beta hydrolase fold domain-containing protein [Agromyces seonyuensis]
MDASLLAPELAGRKWPAAPVGSRPGRALVRAAMHLMPKARSSTTVRVERIEIHGGQPVDVFTPVRFGADGPDAALLWIHGGGMVIGASAQDADRCTQIAEELGITVVSAEYRLAPEHPYPAPLDDVAGAWGWLQRHAVERGIDPERVAIGGQSAGGGLAAGLVLRLHDLGGVQPAAQWLYCPMIDDRTAADRTRDEPEHFVWTNRANLVGWGAYLRGVAEAGASDVPAYAAPSRRTDLAGLPPAWIGVGDIDLFAAEDRAYAEALAAAGVDTSFVVVPGAPHGFESLAGTTSLARDYDAGARAWLAERLAVPSPT